MVPHENALVAHASGDQASADCATRLSHHKNTMSKISATRLTRPSDTVISRAWSAKVPALCNISLSDAILQQERKPLAGDVVYVTEVRHHVLTDAELNAAAHVVIGAQP